MNVVHSRLLPGFKYLTLAATVFLVAGSTMPESELSEPSAPPATPALAPQPARAPAAPPVAPLVSSRSPASAAQIAALRTLLEQQDRLVKVAAPILLNNAALCKRNTRNVTAFIAKTQFSYSSDVAAAARAAFGLGDRLQIMTVFPDSAAASSGLLSGDVLLAVGDNKIAAGPNAERDGMKMIESASKGRSAISLTILRGNAPLTVNLPLSRACAFDIELGNTDNVNSYTDGRRVMVTRGMLDFVRSDEELAYVLAKEIAHAALVRTARPGMHAMIDKLMVSQATAGAAARTPPLQPYVPVSDATADKLALYMLVLAGDSIDNVLPFWQRVATQVPASNPNSYTALHSATAYRLSVIKAVIATIKLKQSNNLPLIP